MTSIDSGYNGNVGMAACGHCCDHVAFSSGKKRWGDLHRHSYDRPTIGPLGTNGPKKPTSPLLGRATIGPLGTNGPKKGDNRCMAKGPPVPSVLKKGHRRAHDAFGSLRSPLA